MPSGLLTLPDTPRDLPLVAVARPSTPTALGCPFITGAIPVDMPRTPIPVVPSPIPKRPALELLVDVASARRAAGGRFAGEGFVMPGCEFDNDRAATGSG